MIVALDAKRRLTVPAGLAPASPASPGDYFDAHLRRGRRRSGISALGGQRELAYRTQSLSGQPG